MTGEYERIGFTPNVRVKEIITHKRELGGKKVKLERPIIVMEYVDTERTFTTYQEEINRMVSFKRWKQI